MYLVKYCPNYLLRKKFHISSFEDEVISNFSAQLFP